MSQTTKRALLPKNNLLRQSIQKKNHKSQRRPGNQNGIILKEPEIRQAAYVDFCRHIGEGFPQESWSFNEDGYRCSYQTILSYIKNDVVGEFDPFLKEQAHSQAFKKLYTTGLELMTGKIKFGSPRIWETVMRNINRRFGWDAEQINQDNKSHVQKLAESIRSEALTETEEGDRAGR